MIPSSRNLNLIYKSTPCAEGDLAGIYIVSIIGIILYKKMP
jgi:hypothetical protein